MIAFIDDHRAAHGALPICRVLPIAPSTDHAHAARRADPAKVSARARRDAELGRHVRRVFEENFGVYAVRKVWRQLGREGVTMARCTVARLMREMGLQGIVRGRTGRTTVSDRAAPCPLDRVNRDFKAERPNALWVADFTSPPGPASSMSPSSSTPSPGAAFFFTDHDRDIVFAGDTYRADAGFARTAIRSDAGRGLQSSR